MSTQSKWVVNGETKNQIIRASTLKPWLDYAAEIVDSILDVLVQKKKFDLDKHNLQHYTKKKENSYTSLEFKRQLNFELEISCAIEALRQVRRRLDSVFGLGNIILVLSPTISIVRIVRSCLLFLFTDTDLALGELSSTWRSDNRYGTAYRCKG